MFHTKLFYFIFAVGPSCECIVGCSVSPSCLLLEVLKTYGYYNIDTVCFPLPLSSPPISHLFCPPLSFLIWLLKLDQGDPGIDFYTSTDASEHLPFLVERVQHPKRDLHPAQRLHLIRRSTHDQKSILHYFHLFLIFFSLFHYH